MLLNPEEYLRRLVRDKTFHSLLDVGTGVPGIFDFARWDEDPNLWLRACLDVHSLRQDIPRTWLKVIADARHLPFKPNVFDVVQCTEMLEHIPSEDQGQVLDELERVAKHLVFVTTSDVTKHLGEPQRQAEILNPHQRYISMPAPKIFSERGFKFERPTEHNIKAWKWI